jgi:hypothetical protein
VELAALDEFLSSYLASDHRGKESGRVFRMICGYFEDMDQVLTGLHAVMRLGAVVAIVIGTQVFAGKPLPTDLLLAQLAEAAASPSRRSGLPARRASPSSSGPASTTQ